tara:strand:- start:632 stop:871 length:240 start_codon:yes stop_codon:yes gene_type:complete
MYIRRILYSSFGQKLISILLGLGLATLFRKVCNDRNCLIFKGPELDKMNNKIYKFEDKCYKYVPNVKKCDKNKKIIEFA